jgi:hypothetical protein
MRDMIESVAKPWLCVGDFNEILFSHEKEGGREKSQAKMDIFREAFEVRKLHDLGFEGDIFTWRNNRHRGDEYIRERLDRAVANDLWRLCFPMVRVFNSNPRHSDHRPVIVTSNRVSNGGGGRQERNSFHFEVSWLGEKKCVEVVAKAWREAMEGTTPNTLGALKVAAAGLIDWSQNVLGDLEKRRKKVIGDLEKCRCRHINEEQVGKELVLKCRLEKLEEQIDMYWKQ